MYLIDLQFWSEVGVDLFQQVYSSAGDVITSLNYHLGARRIWNKISKLNVWLHVFGGLKHYIKEEPHYWPLETQEGVRRNALQDCVFFILQYSGKQRKPSRIGPCGREDLKKSVASTIYTCAHFKSSFVDLILTSRLQWPVFSSDKLQSIFCSHVHQN